MDVVNQINKKIILDNELKELDNYYNNKKMEIIKQYDEEKCNHNIVIKLYGSLQARSNKKPDYICLGCLRTLLDFDIDRKNIIDLTTSNDGSSYMGDYNCLISYIQYLVYESEKKLSYTDFDFIDMLDNNKEKIKIPKGFNPLEFHKSNIK